MIDNLMTMMMMMPTDVEGDESPLPVSDNGTSSLSS